MTDISPLQEKNQSHEIWTSSDLSLTQHSQEHNMIIKKVIKDMDNLQFIKSKRECRCSSDPSRIQTKTNKCTGDIKNYQANRILTAIYQPHDPGP